MAALRSKVRSSYRVTTCFHGFLAMPTVVFTALAEAIPTMALRNRPIDADSPCKRGILRAVKFLFNIKSHPDLTIRPTGALRAKKVFTKENQWVILGKTNRV